MPSQQSENRFGSVPGILPGHEFANRMELWSTGVHRQTQAGISARQGKGAESIVLSGGYEDDEDLGAVIIYTGRGGRSAESQQQVADQTLTGANRELARNVITGLPVRVTRKVNEAGRNIYRYAGLYRVAQHWAEPGRSGHLVWRFRLEELPELLAEPVPTRQNQPADLFASLGGVQEPDATYGPAPRRISTVLRLVRDTAVTRQVKSLYDYHCQVCRTRLSSPAGPYAEAAHVQPLGTPHHGPDVLANVLCLCPNHHVLFDYGSFSIAPGGNLLGLPGQLQLHKKHPLGSEFLAYHRTRFYEPQL
jgi:putative restriction endonuclease